MRKLIIALPLLLLGCRHQIRSQEQEARALAEQDRGQRAAVAMVMEKSVVICEDGNQVRAMLFGQWGNTTVFSAYTILDENGKPKRCVKRVRRVASVVEEVPEPALPQWRVGEHSQ